MRAEQTKMREHSKRKRKVNDRRQQARFAIELTIYAVLFPLLFVVISLIYPIAKQLIGVATEDLEPLNAMLAYCLKYWWALIVALALTGFISVLFSHRIFGPMSSFEHALLQKELHPAEPVDPELRPDDYFHNFSDLLAKCLNGLQRVKDPGQIVETEEAEAFPDPQMSDQDSESSV